ncbi:hypothetical protein [Streptomyces sp. NRRL B-24484]|uniref:hypothetical protein n=1 Tax=Streptomyces sp. NRRL B-24484 TaxID=1463833 RepID=UPI00069497D6|nr:hypothetical protein [Streptomyces sp. NRRL B-24484]
MKNTKLAAAVGAGYLLGPFHKVRWAMALAGMVAGKRITTDPAALLSGLPESSPQLRQLAGSVRGELADAGRKAAVAAAGNRVDALTDSLQRRTESLRSGSADGDEPGDEEPEDEYEEAREDEDPAPRSRRRVPAGSR